ncbi:MAG: thioredoxin domain-containing protein, partial [Proteobacteria bacterium]|nr:thioredoxin domain-containing protein [Pseudomonadota bacterium]
MGNLLMAENRDNGGWGGRRSGFGPTLSFLLDRAALSPDALLPLERTLNAVSWGALCDHFGRGFFRSVDSNWQYPKYEKTLAINAQMALVFADASALFEDAAWAKVAERSLEYLVFELEHPHGGFADGHRAVKAHYVWTDEEVLQVLAPADARRLTNSFHLDENRAPYLTSAMANGLIGPRRAMFEARQLRQPPPLNSQRVVGANGLAISALARGAMVLDQRPLLPRARKTARLILENRLDGGLLPHVLGDPLSQGVLDDYAFAGHGLLDLYEADLNIAWLDGAAGIGRAMIARFSEPKGGFYYVDGLASERVAPLLIWGDGENPAGVG